MALSHDMVAHRWAHQNGRGNSAKGHNMFYDGDTIYSYGGHFPIARLLDGVVLFNCRSYSVSTSKHQTITRRAASHLKVFEVPFVNAASKATHKENIKYFFGVVNGAITSASRRRRATYKQWDLERAQEACDEARAYARTFKLGRVKLPSMPDDIAEYMEGVRAEIAVQAKKRAKVEAERKRLADIAHQARMVELRTVTIPAWLRGDNIRLPYYHDMPTMMRVIKGAAPQWEGDTFTRGAADMVETSKGAKFPVSDCVAAFPLLLDLATEAQEYCGKATPKEPIRFAGFAVNDVSTSAVRVGCHLLTWKEVKRLARLIGFTWQGQTFRECRASLSHA